MAEQERLAQWLLHCTPALETYEPTEERVLEEIERTLGTRVGFVSRGPRASDVSVRGSYTHLA